MSELARAAYTLARRQHWCCIWCEFEMASTYGRAEQMLRHELPAGAPPIAREVMHRAAQAIVVSFDHFDPRAAGGADCIENGFASCRWCNVYRATEDPLVFKGKVAALVAAGRHPRQILRATGNWPRHEQYRAIALVASGAVA